MDRKISPMLKRSSVSRRARGFTLIELMITVAIATILITVAVPAYTHQIRKSRRTDAKTALLDLAAREERLFSTTNSYSATLADLGYSSATVGSGYYTVAVTTAAANPATSTPATFTVTATPQNSQAQDTDCQTLSVDNTGRRSATGSSGDTSATCWG